MKRGLGKVKLFETEAELEELYNMYEDWRIANPLERKELLKSGDLAGASGTLELPRPRSVVSFCQYLGISRKTFYQWMKDGRYGDTLPRIHDAIFQHQADLAQIDVYNPGFTKTRLHMVEKSEVNEKKDVEGYSIL